MAHGRQAIVQPAFVKPHPGRPQQKLAKLRNDMGFSAFLLSAGAPARSLKSCVFELDASPPFASIAPPVRSEIPKDILVFAPGDVAERLKALVC
jgi:hypothetical protein